MEVAETRRSPSVCDKNLTFSETFSLITTFLFHVANLGAKDLETNPFPTLFLCTFANRNYPKENVPRAEVLTTLN